ncbi:PREDICTED: putative fasciclin-like arabinogalactan protein 20 [Theobroma cacao]|uniref:Fasciclin-like arabinogalactan protein 20 n=1 Tax=Theobroma cacao TaxID=3641 RepID=A0AB32VJF8_THECC|nr:PREDICTED: putative fasciclin-like arabinogalactan protein 20 [Theobroma cacao]
MAVQLLLSLVFFFLPSLSFSASSNIISNAAQVLSDIGMVSMSLTLQYGPQTLIPQTQNLTIFSPSDTVFAKSGQPSLSLLRFHFSPQSLPLSFLNALPFGSKLTTLSPSHSLIVTSSPSDDQLSLNGVKIGKTPAYDDGTLVVYKLDKFFDPSFKVSKHGCVGADTFRSFNSFDKASEALRSKGYFAMASFLDSQLESPRANVKLTIFAPSDEMIKPFMGNWSVYPSIFLSLIVPCKIPGRDLVNWDEGVVLETYLGGFNITVAKSDANVTINGAKVMVRDLFQSDWLVVHGLSDSGGLARVAARSGAAENSKLDKILLATCCLFLSKFLLSRNYPSLVICPSGLFWVRVGSGF